MLAIRLARTGRKKYATYRIVVADSRRATTGKYVNLLGHYNPHTKELVLKKEAALEYLKNGAQPSPAVARLLKSQKLELPKWVQLKQRPKRSPKKEADATTETRVADEKQAESTQEAAVALTAAANAETKETKPADEQPAETADDLNAKAKAVQASSQAAAEAALDAAEAKPEAESSQK